MHHGAHGLAELLKFKRAWSLSVFPFTFRIVLSIPLLSFSLHRGILLVALVPTVSLASLSSKAVPGDLSPFRRRFVNCTLRPLIATVTYHGQEKPWPFAATSDTPNSLRELPFALSRPFHRDSFRSLSSSITWVPISVCEFSQVELMVKKKGVEGPRKCLPLGESALKKQFIIKTFLVVLSRFWNCLNNRA